MPKKEHKYLDHNSPMPSGKYKGTPMGNVPPAHLIYIYTHHLRMNPGLRRYIFDNLEKLKNEAPFT